MNLSTLMLPGTCNPFEYSIQNKIKRLCICWNELRVYLASWALNNDSESEGGLQTHWFPPPKTEQYQNNESRTATWTVPF